MLTVIKILVVLTWLMMVLLLVFAPAGSQGGGEAIIFHVSQWGPEVERDFLHTLKTLPPKSQLMIVDDSTDALRSQVIERLIIRNQGVIAVRPRV